MESRQSKADFRDNQRSSKQLNYNNSLRGIKIRLLLNVIVFFMVVFVLSPHTDIPATWALIIVNIVVFLQVRLNRLSVYSLGVAPIVIENREYYRIFTSAFAHKEIWHIFLNMFALYNIGGWVERFLGTPYFLLVYFQLIIGSGIICAIIRKKMNKYISSIGASGVICGLIGLYLSIRIVIIGSTSVITVVTTALILIAVTASKKTDSLNHIISFLIGIMLGILYLIHA